MGGRGKCFMCFLEVVEIWQFGGIFYEGIVLDIVLWRYYKESGFYIFYFKVREMEVK